jgi:hypothetical protein
LGPKKIYVELLGLLVSVNKDFFKYACISFPIFQTAVRYTLRICVKITNLKEVPSNHGEHSRKELVRVLSIRVRN